MSAADIVRRWRDEREAVLEADTKGLERPSAPSIAIGSWNGSDTDAPHLQAEASVLRFLERELVSEAEVEAAMAAAGVVLMARAEASAVVDEALHRAEVDLPVTADGLLTALGWPT